MKPKADKPRYPGHTDRLPSEAVFVMHRCDYDIYFRASYGGAFYFIPAGGGYTHVPVGNLSAAYNQAWNPELMRDLAALAPLLQ